MSTRPCSPDMNRLYAALQDATLRGTSSIGAVAASVASAIEHETRAVDLAKEYLVAAEADEAAAKAELKPLSEAFDADREHATRACRDARDTAASGVNAAYASTCYARGLRMAHVARLKTLTELAELLVNMPSAKG